MDCIILWCYRNFSALSYHVGTFSTAELITDEMVVNLKQYLGTKLRDNFRDSRTAIGRKTRYMKHLSIRSLTSFFHCMYYGKDICKGIVHCYAIIPTFFPVLLSYTFVTFFFLLGEHERALLNHAQVQAPHCS